MSDSALHEPIGDLDHMSKLDERRSVSLTRSFKRFKDFLEKHIDKMTGARGNVFYGLETRCRGDECTYDLNTKEITADGNCLFDCLLYMLGDARDERSRRTQDAECDGLRRQLIRHYIDSGGVSNGTYNLEKAVTNKRSYTPTIIVESFVDIYKTNVIVFELFNNGNFNAQLFMNRTVPFDHVEFLILTQNPGHFTTLRKVRGFEQPREFIEKLRSIPSDLGGTLGDMMVDEGVSYAERTHYQPLCYNYQHADELFSIGEVDLSEISPRTQAEIERSLRNELPRPPTPRPPSPKPPSPKPKPRPRPKPRPKAKAKAPVKPHSIPPARISLSPLLPLNHNYGKNVGLAIGANLEARSRSLSSRTRRALNEAVSRSPTISPRTRKALNEAVRTPRSRSATISLRTRRALNEAAAGRTPRTESRRSSSRASTPRARSASPRTRRALNEAIRTPRSASRSSRLKNRLNSRRAINVAPNASPATKERIAKLALNEAPNASINTMNQIARLARGSRSTSPRSPRRRRFRLSSIVNKHIPRLFGFRR